MIIRRRSNERNDDVRRRTCRAMFRITGMTAIDVTTAVPDSSDGSVDNQPIGLCLDCGYALRGLPTPRCPECGREFDPLDRATMNIGRELSPLAKWVLGPIRWEVNLLSWGALAFAMW